MVDVFRNVVFEVIVIVFLLFVALPLAVLFYIAYRRKDVDYDE